MMIEMKKMDSLKKSRQQARELEIELNNIKDTLQSDDIPSQEEVREGRPGRPAKDSGNKKKTDKPDMNLPDNKKNYKNSDPTKRA